MSASAHTFTVEIGVVISEEKERTGGRRSTCKTDELANPGTVPPAADNHRQLLAGDSTPFECRLASGADVSDAWRGADRRGRDAMLPTQAFGEFLIERRGLLRGA